MRYRLFTSLIKFIHRYFILYAFRSGLVFLVSFWKFVISVCKYKRFLFIDLISCNCTEFYSFEQLFVGVLRVFCIWYIIWKWWQFYFHSNMKVFYLLLFCLIYLVMTSSTILNKNGKRWASLSYNWFWRKAFSFSPFSKMLAMCLSYVAFLLSWGMSLDTYFVEFLSWMGVELLKFFFYRYWDDMIPYWNTVDMQYINFRCTT